MVRLIAGDRPRPVYVAVESPQADGPDQLRFVISEQKGYRSVSKVTRTVPRRGTMMIDYESVYPEGFHHGLNVSGS
jgi:hypothetical protein